MDVRGVYSSYLSHLEDHVGIAIGGVNARLSFSSEDGLGQPVARDENESLFLRVTKVQMPSGLPVTIVLSRVQAHASDAREYPPRTNICILVPRATASRSYEMNMQKPEAGHTTIGAKWVHAYPIKFFASMPHKKADRVPGATYCYDGYECLLPSSITIRNGKERHTTGVSVGFHRYSLAARLLNVQIPVCAPPSRPVDNKDYNDWITGNEDRRNALSEAVDPESAYLADTDALRILELSSMAFSLMLISKAIFAPALPDMLHVPVGIPMMITFATSVAMNPARYGLVQPTATDSFACERFRDHVRSSWRGLSGESGVDVRAVDVAMNRGYKVACGKAKKSVVLRNLQLLQRIGQRLLTEVFMHQDYPTGTKVPTMCRSVFAKVDQAHQDDWGAVVRASDNEIAFSSPCELAVTLVRTYNACEQYLRNGRYVEAQLTPTNETARRNGSPAGGREANMDAMCLLAVDGAAANFADLCASGPVTTSALTGLDMFLVSPHQVAPCCVCKKPVHVLKAQVFPLGGSACLMCRRRRCFSCTDVVVSTDDDDYNPCLYCDPSSVPSDDIECF